MEISVTSLDELRKTIKQTDLKTEALHRTWCRTLLAFERC